MSAGPVAPDDWPPPVDAASVVALLRDAGFAVTTLGSLAWRFHVSAEVEATVRRAEEWLLFDAAAPPNRAVDSPPPPLAAWDRLVCNAELPGSAKLVLSDGRLRARAELPLDAGADLVQRIRRACVGIAIACGCAPLAADEPAITGAAEPNIGELCAAAGWSSAARPDDVWAVALDTGGDCYQAFVTCSPGGTVRAAVDLVRGELLEPLCQQALAVLLLQTCGAVRMVRAAALSDAALLEVVLEAQVTPAEVGHALAALSVACSLCGREAELLSGDAAVAHAYLDRMERCAAP